MRLKQKVSSLWRYLFVFMLLPSISHAQQAGQQQSLKPVVSIIIDDLGYRLKYGKRAVNLPGRLTFSFLPFSPHARQLAELAYQKQQEIMVHMPMESNEAKRLGPGGLYKTMSEEELVKTVQQDLAAIPHASGFNNHMGSLLTRKNLAMTTVMKAAYRPGLYFIDSKTTSDSVALQQAETAGMYGATRDVFLDHVTQKAFIEKQLNHLVRLAKQQGSAIAIGHPHKVTLEILEQWIPAAETYGVTLVPVSELIQLRQQRRLAWQESLSPSPPAVKN